MALAAKAANYSLIFVHDLDSNTTTTSLDMHGLVVDHCVAYHLPISQGIVRSILLSIFMSVERERDQIMIALDR